MTKFFFLATLSFFLCYAQEWKALKTDLNKHIAAIHDLLPELSKKEAILADTISKGLGTSAIEKAEDNVKGEQKKLKKLYKALTKTTGKLVKLDNPEAVKVITNALKMAEKKADNHNDVYFILGKGAASFKTKKALDKIGDFILKNKSMPISKDLGSGSV